MAILQREREPDVSSFLEWLEDWYLGIDEIDRQHQQLVVLFNRIANELRPSDESLALEGVALSLVQQLLEETRQHFKDEEGIMREQDYPELVDHHREHIMLLAELQDYIREIGEGERQLDFDSLTALKHWLIDHVIDSDQAFARYRARQ